MMALGPIAVFPKTVLSWNVSGHEDIDEESLSLFVAVEPKIGKPDPSMVVFYIYFCIACYFNLLLVYTPARL